MRRQYPTTPLLLKLTLAAVFLFVLAWWTQHRVDRAGNERRLSVIASDIAGRRVKVHCPGPIMGVLGKDQVEGSVQFDAQGNPSDVTELRATSCAELDALAEGRRGDELACTERARILCGRHGRDVAMAVDTITHESFHLQGVQDEARTECNALQTMAAVALGLGATPAQAAALARGQYTESYPLMPDAYRSPECADGRSFDLRPEDPNFPS